MTGIRLYRSNENKLHHPRCQYVVPHMQEEMVFQNWDALYDAVTAGRYGLCKRCKPLKV